MGTEQRWSIGRELAGQLGLDPDQPVVEYQRHTAEWQQDTAPTTAPTLDGLPLIGRFSAAHLASQGTANGATITSWPNLAPGFSGSAFGGSAVFRANQGGRAAVELIGSPVLSFTPPNGTWSVTGGELMMVKARNSHARADNYNAGGYSGDTYYPFSDGQLVREDFRSTVQWDWNRGTRDFTAWHRHAVAVYASGGVYRRRSWYNDELVASAAAAFTVQAPGGVGADSGGISLGNVGGAGAAGWFSDILVFSRELTDAERTQARAYVDAQYNAPPPPVLLPPELVQTWATDPARTAALSYYSTSYGRQRPADDTEPLAANVGLVRAWAGSLPAVGERFRLRISDAAAAALGLPAADQVRFTGEVTDADVDVDGMVALVGIGRRARALSAPVGLDRYPAESGSARVARVLADVAGQVPDVIVGTVDTTTAQLLARSAERTDAHALLAQVVVDTGGQLVEQRDGTLDWHGPDHRRGAVSQVALSGATELLKPFRWTQGVGDVINDAEVSYGKPTTSVRVTDDDSADLATGLGLHSTQLGTQLADAGSAYARGTDLVGRRSRPTWRLPEVTVELVRSLAAAKRAAVLKLRHGHLVTLTELPPGGPYTATPRGAFVEGVTESCTRTSWSLTLSVADPALAGVAMRWIDIPDAETWDTLSPLTWLGLATAVPSDL